MLTSNHLRQMFFDFFASKYHAIISSASLIPDNDPTVLFTTAGMHPLTPYLLGQSHPQGVRLANVQKCIRTGDIDDVGDDSHCTFFEMLGNWSLGDYFKKESIQYSYEFLTSPSYLNIPIEKLSFSVFAGDNDAPKDEESAKYWMNCGVKASKIFYLPKKNNWWGPAGLTGPCGPDTEIFYDSGAPKCSPQCSPACDCGKYLEIWNNVFMQYNKNSDGTYSPLKQHNVDTGMGLERTLVVLNGFDNVYQTDLFIDAIKLIGKLSGLDYLSSQSTKRNFRIIADHIRTATFIIGDRNGITPGNVDQGYVLRRLIRRAVRLANNIGLKKGDIAVIANLFIDKYEDIYSELVDNKDKIVTELLREEERFIKTLAYGEKEFARVISTLDGTVIDGATAFKLYDTYGFPVELTVECAQEKGLTVDVEGFKEKFAEHQLKSQLGSQQRFKGGLIDNGDETTKLHTATHLLQAALRKVLGNEVMQKGSNITAERLRFDFSFSRPMTDDEIKQVQDIVNEQIAKQLPVIEQELEIGQARKLGAMGLFGDKYGEIVKVYTIGDFSMEMCGGPHVTNTAHLGNFVIVKEQSSSSGVRRIRAELK